MSETQRPPQGSNRAIGDDRPTGPDPDDPIGLSSGPSAAAAPATRTVLARGERVPWPRRLIATGLLAAVLALVLHTLPRPYQTIPTGVVRGLGDAYGSLRHVYRNDVAALEPIAGEASEAERKAYARELWRYRWLGSFREILLRFSEWIAASCMVVAISMIAVERRRLRRELRSRGGSTDASVLRRETIDTDASSIAAAGDAAGRGAAAPIPPPPATVAPPPALRVPLVRETGDEVTPPSPTPVPSRIPGALELRPAAFDDDDLARATDNQTPNLARRPVVASAKAASAATPAPSQALPVFFAERRHPEPHPVVHPGDPAPPAEPMPTPAPAPSPLPMPAKADAAPAPAPTDPSTDESLPVWLRTR